MRAKLMTLMAATVALSSNVYADNATFDADVNRVLIDDSNYSGCMVSLTTDPQSKLPSCGAEWVTLDCLKAFPESSGSIATNKLSQAQLALVTGRSVRVRVTDTRKANGYCFAQRIDVR